MTPFASQQAWSDVAKQQSASSKATSESSVSTGPKSTSQVPAPFSRYSEADIPTEYGTFRVVCYREWTTDGQLKEHVAVVNGDVRGTAVHVRVHSECLTGEVLHSLKCDCREQLDLAMRRIGKEGRGAVLYLRQEGRGIGLGNKIRAYRLQQDGVDTVDANRMLGLPDDSRNFDIAAFMIRDLGMESVVLLTNNPLKVKSLQDEGIEIVRREPVLSDPNEHNVNYLRTKGERMGHSFDERVTREADAKAE